MARVAASPVVAGSVPAATATDSRMTASSPAGEGRPARQRRSPTAAKPDETPSDHPTATQSW